MPTDHLVHIPRAALSPASRSHILFGSGPWVRPPQDGIRRARSQSRARIDGTEAVRVGGCQPARWRPATVPATPLFTIVPRTTDRGVARRRGMRTQGARRARVRTRDGERYRMHDRLVVCHSHNPIEARGRSQERRLAQTTVAYPRDANASQNHTTRVRFSHSATARHCFPAPVTTTTRTQRGVPGSSPGHSIEAVGAVAPPNLCQDTPYDPPRGGSVGAVIG